MLTERKKVPRWLNEGTHGIDSKRGLRHAWLQTTPWVVGGLRHADTEIPVITVTEVQLQTHSTGRGSVVQIETNVFFCGGCVKKNKVRSAWKCRN